MQPALTSLDVRRIIGYHGGVFYVRYIRFDGTEVMETRRVIRCTSVPGEAGYLVCEDGWIPLQSLRALEAYREEAYRESA